MLIDKGAGSNLDTDVWGKPYVFPLEKTEILSNRDFLRLSVKLGLTILESRAKLAETLVWNPCSLEDIKLINDFVEERVTKSHKIIVHKFHMNLNEHNYKKDPYTYTVPSPTVVTATIIRKVKIKDSGEVFYNARVDSIEGNYVVLSKSERISLKPSHFTYANDG